MNQALEYILDQIDQAAREQLKTIPEYRHAQARRDQVWEAFCDQADREAIHTVLEIQDTDGRVKEMERNFYFLAGAQLGIALGEIRALR